MNCIVGYSGLIGKTICRDIKFDNYINSANLNSIHGGKFDTLFLCCLPAEKWRANLDPESDLTNVLKIQRALRTVSANRIVLISTIDVYADVSNADENSSTFTNEPYGKNRWLFEQFTTDSWAHSHVIRLPGLFGKGLKKNYIYDLANKNRLEMINLNTQFQWYPLSELVTHLKVILAQKPGIYNLVTEPIKTSDLVCQLFPEIYNDLKSKEPTFKYNVRTINSHLFPTSLNGNYVMSSKHVFSSLAKFLKSETSNT